MSQIWQRYVREHGRALDVALALLLIANAFPGTRLGISDADVRSSWWLGVLLTAVGAAAMLRRREYPRSVAILTMADAIILAALGFVPTVLVLGPLMIALYALADRTDRRTANTIAFTGIAVLAGTAVIAGPHQTIALTVISPAACLLLPVALGTTARVRRDFLAAVQARADHAERTREEEARHRVAEERRRIARELHDVVAHHLALANAQAGTAAHLVDSHPEQARKILADLSGTTSSALRELKATVGLLRDVDGPDAPLEPAPGLAQLPALTAAFETGGLTVAVNVEGVQQPLSPGVDLTAYRIVQEALTNVTKHAATRLAHVRLAYANDRLTITVADEGGTVSPAGVGASAVGAGAVPAAATGASGRGFGLIGMRERALSVGGRLQVGRRPEGGFNVTAELPLYPHDLDEGRSS